MVLGVIKLSIIFLVLLSVSQVAAFGQEESAPQTRLSSKGLAYVTLSTIPPSPVAGEQTIILIKFSDPQTRAPRGDFYYNFIIRNQTGPVLTVPQATTITGEVGIPFQFTGGGNYQVEIDLNDTSTQTNYASLDEVTFPIYVAKGGGETTNQTFASTGHEGIPSININNSPDTNRVLFNGILIAVGIAIVFFLVRRRIISRRKTLSYK